MPVRIMPGRLSATALILALALLATALAALPQTTGSPQSGLYGAPLRAQGPTVDGNIELSEWNEALSVDGFANDGLLERRRARAYMTATATHLFFAIRSELPASGAILSDVTRDSENLVYDDSVEVWLDPTPGADRGARYQMLANARGFRWFRKHAYGGATEDAGWKGDWTIANGSHDGEWHCEIAVPVGSVGRSSADQGAWGVNLCRNWKQEWAWSSLGGGPYRPTEVVRFASGAPSIALVHASDVISGKVHVTFTVTNNGMRTSRYSPELRLQRELLPEVAIGEPVDIEPGRSTAITLRVDDHTSGRFTLIASLRDDDGTLMKRTVAWKADRRPWTWTTTPRVPPPLDARFAYYPYSNRMRLMVDVSNMPAAAKVERVEATVRPVGGKPVRTVRLDALRDGKQEMSFALPPLRGTYEIALKAFGSGVPDVEVVKPFERTVFPWERTKLGTSTKVYPPFTPMRVAGKRVSVVLRDHEMTDGGLWRRVVSRGRDLLAGPIRWETGSPVHEGPLKVVESAGHRAVMTGSFRSGRMAGSVLSTWDYDGMMRVDLTLKRLQTGAASTPDRNALTLVIPVRPDQATHYHAMGDGIRNTLYARLPEGLGAVWTSKSVQCNDLPPQFCSYIFVGTPVRGICWFAENDRGWLWDRTTPNVEIVRKPGVVELRVHLVMPGPHMSARVSYPRRITFGLQAAPVKPRLDADWQHKYRRDRYSLLGTDINWLALGDCGSVYPANKDLYLWEMIKRGNRERLTEDDIRKVIERARPHFEPYGAERVASLEAHVRYNLTARYGTRMIFYYNRASFQAAPEFETFKDEWSLTDYRSIDKGNGIYEIQIVPSASYIDHAVWWYDRSFDLGGNQGVYWDNWFFRGSYNTGATGAYAGPDGSVTASTGIWGLRELAKRTFQLMNERRMKPITMAHMTSTAVLPLLSFCTVQYDWEWKYSEGDVQGRFSRDYILMVSNGELAGTWPVLLGDHGPLAEDRHTARTFVACALVHELDCPYPSWTEAGRMQLALLKPVDEILARPGVRAFRYWDDEPQPVRADDADIPVVVYSVKGSEAIVGIAGYADSDRQVRLRVDGRALGFPAGFAAADTETGQRLPVEGGMILLEIKRHDVRVLRLSPTGSPQ